MKKFLMVLTLSFCFCLTGCTNRQVGATAGAAGGLLVGCALACSSGGLDVLLIPAGVAIGGVLGAEIGANIDDNTYGFTNIS